jgi:hypothetical protein
VIGRGPTSGGTTIDTSGRYLYGRSRCFHGGGRFVRGHAINADRIGNIGAMKGTEVVVWQE